MFSAKNRTTFPFQMQPLRSVYNAGFSKLFVNYIGLVYKTEVGDIVPEGIF